MRMRCDFVEGSSVVIAGDHVVCYVVDHPLSDLVGQLTEVILSGGRLEAVMNGLVHSTIATLPPFGLVGADGDGVSVVVRGDVSCRVDTPTGAVVIDGTGIRTWSERHFAQASTVELGADLGSRSVPFCVQHGVVAASGLRVTMLPAGTSPWLEPGPADAVQLESPTNVMDHDPAEDVVVARDEAVVGDDDSDDERVEDDDGYDHLFGATVVRSVEGAAVESAAAEQAAPSGPEPSDAHESPDPDRTMIVSEEELGRVGDSVIGEVPGAGREADSSPPVAEVDVNHDGLTVSLAQLQKLRADAASAAPAQAASAPSQAGSDGPLVHAVECSQGHLNPPHGALCRSCGEPIADQVQFTAPRPPLGRLVFSHGQVETLSQTTLIGRSPRLHGEIVGEVPALVEVPSPDRDISRTHVELRVDGWQVQVIDCGSTNGTIVQLPGRDPQSLRPGEPVPIGIGAWVDLGGETGFVFEAEA